MLPDGNGESVDLDQREKEHGLQRDVNGEWKHEPIHVREDERQSAERHLALVFRSSFGNTDSDGNIYLHCYSHIDNDWMQRKQIVQLGHN